MFWISGILMAYVSVMVFLLLRQLLLGILGLIHAHAILGKSLGVYFATGIPALVASHATFWLAENYVTSTSPWFLAISALISLSFLADYYKEQYTRAYRDERKIDESVSHERNVMLRVQAVQSAYGWQFMGAITGFGFPIYSLLERFQ